MLQTNLKSLRGETLGPIRMRHVAGEARPFFVELFEHGKEKAEPILVFMEETHLAALELLDRLTKVVNRAIYTNGRKPVIFKDTAEQRLA
jgi:hypothetical protein